MHASTRSTLIFLSAVSAAALAAPASPDIDEDARSWRWDAKVVHWAGGVYGSHCELDAPGAIERRAQELADAGVTVAQLDGLHMRNSSMDRMPGVKDYLRRVVEACHRHGIKVVEHHSATIVIYGTYRGHGARWLFDNPDILQRDIQYDYALKTPCINNPKFRRHYFDYLVDFLRETDVDGFQLDEAHFSGSRACGCSHCRAKLKKETGVVIPDDDTDPFFRFDTRRNCLSNLDDLRVVKFLEWRSRAVVDFFSDLHKELEKVKANLTLMTYTTHYGLTSRFDMRNGSGTIFDKAEVCDWLGTEIMSRNVYADVRSVFFMRKAMGALGLSARAPVFAYVYHLGSPHIARMGWAIQTMHGQVALMDFLPDDMAYLDWKDRMNGRGAESLADIALVFGDQTRKWGRDVAYKPDLGGWSECMTDAHILHDIILDRDLVAERLKKYRLLILPSVSCMTEAQIEAVSQYVREGGRLLATGNTSTQNELGFTREDFGLRDILGLKYGGLGRAGLFLKSGDEAVLLGQVAFNVRALDPTRAEILAELQVGGQTVGPGVTKCRAGKGTAFYDACRLGIYNMEFEGKLGKKRLAYQNAALHKVAVDLVRRAHGGPLPLQATADFPHKVFVTAYRRKLGEKEQILVHLLNATGVPDVKSGETLTAAVPDDPWPKLKSDLTFEIALPAISDAAVVSPEFEGPRPVQIESEGHRPTVTVTRDDLRWFSTVVIDIAPTPAPAP